LPDVEPSSSLISFVLSGYVLRERPEFFETGVKPGSASQKRNSLDRAKKLKLAEVQVGYIITRKC
jgi:hypothetical protein